MAGLLKVAADESWCEDVPRLRFALTNKIDWYESDLRIMRNQFVHNHRIAHLTPHTDNQQTVVLVKKPQRGETENKFFLDQFLNWSLGKFLLFSVAIARGVTQLGAV
jgi:hypothetical protein